jgi:hypothetical protein
MAAAAVPVSGRVATLAGAPVAPSAIHDGVDRVTPIRCQGFLRIVLCLPRSPTDGSACMKRASVGSVIKKRRKRMAKKKHRKLLKKTRVQRRRLGK